MKISTEQLEAVIASKGNVMPASEVVDTAVIRLVDQDLIKQTVENINQMPDREEVIASLKARIESGEYNPTSDDIADAMVRRTLADKMR